MIHNITPDKITIADNFVPVFEVGLAPDEGRDPVLADAGFLPLVGLFPLAGRVVTHLSGLTGALDTDW